MKKILLIGHYCTVGGIGVHMQRLVKLLKDDFSITVVDESKLKDACEDVYNIRTKKILKYLHLVIKADIIHVHTLSTIVRLLHVLLGVILFKRMIVTVHSLTLIKNKKDLLLVKLTLKLATKVIVVNNEIKKKLNLPNALVLPAFLPPDLDSQKELPDAIKNYLTLHKHKKTIVGNAFRLNIYNKEDLYGTDLLIEVAKKIKENKDDIKIIFVVTSLDVNKDLFLGYLEKIKEEQLEEQILLYHGVISFVNLIKESDLVVRPTNTDGDALTVREALYLGKPVVASDVVERPKGTILFKNRDSNDLYNKIITNINHKNSLLKDKDTIDNYKRKYENIYFRK